MGDQLSKPSSSSSSNPSSTSTTPDMSSSNPSPTQESKHEKEPTHVSESSEPRASVEESSDPPVEEPPPDLEIKVDGAAPEREVGEEGEEEEEGECGFCLFMKGGGCKDEFVEWEKCVEEGEKNNEDIAERCFEITASLKKCMESHRDYYAPLLKAEEDAMKELEEKEKEREDGTTRSEKEKGIDGAEASKGSVTGSEEEKVKGST